jgi:acetyltransferase
MSIYNLERLFAPRSVAVVGASARPGSLGAAVLANLSAAGFAGLIGIVNPRHREILGRPAVARVDQLPFVPDLVVITAPASTVPDLVRQAGEVGATGCVVISAGLGHGRGSLAEQAETTARASHMRLIGPNCLGAIMPRAKLNASFSARMPAVGDLAMISQSGAIAAAMIDWGAQRSIGFSGIVSVGDQIDVDIADLLDFFAVDASTRAILMYVESIGNARKFMSAARAAARVKPVVVVKAGRKAQGAQAAATHTGALAGVDAVYSAAFHRAGLLRVFDLRELFDCAEALGRNCPLSGRRLAILTNGGGVGVLAIDRLIELGGTPAVLGETARAALDRALPATWSKANPVDIIGDADSARYASAIEALLADDENDAILVMNVQTAVASAADIAKAVANVVTSDRQKRMKPKGVIAAWVGADASTTATFNEAAIPNFPTEDDAVRGFMHMVRYREARDVLMETPPGLPPGFVPDAARAKRVVRDALAQGRAWLDPVEVQAVLSAYGIPIVPMAVAETPEAVRLHAEAFLADSQAVTIKILSPDIVHKSDVGGVRLNLPTAAAAETAAREMLLAVKAVKPSARIDGIVVQPMVARQHGRELIAGIADDPTFGPVIVFGTGGTAVEVIDDKALALPPLDLKLAHDLIGRTRVSHILGQYRSTPAAACDDVALTLVRLAQMSAELAEVRELDINPLIADENGVLALDARIAVAKPWTSGVGLEKTRLAIRPYPNEWCKTLQVGDDWQVAVRPIRPEDEPALIAFLQKTSKEDLRLRFFAPMKEFTHPFVARLTQIDYARAMAFIATDPASNDILGVVRMHSDSVYESAEYAILVRSDLKGRGLGWTLMKLMIAYAKAEGLRHLTGQVLRGNIKMLDMCRALGFSVSVDPDDSDISDVSLPLDRADHASFRLVPCTS